MLGCRRVGSRGSCVSSRDIGGLLGDPKSLLLGLGVGVCGVAGMTSAETFAEGISGDHRAATQLE
jgi:hypothetical protein